MYFSFLSEEGDPRPPPRIRRGYKFTQHLKKKKKKKKRVEAVLASIHNLCFGAKNKKKIGIPLHTQFCYIKVEFKGVYITWICFPNVHPVHSDFLPRKF